MDIKCTVEGQKLTIISPRPLPQGSDNFDRFLFTFSEDWDGLMVFAQFRQGDQVSNEYLTDVTVTEGGKSNAYQAATVPNWLEPGLATMTLYGTGREDVIGTTNYVVMRVQATGFMGEAVTSDLTETLYQQMVNRFIAYEWRYDIVRDFQGAWEALLASIDSPGNTWTELPVKAAATAPADPAVGDYWWDTTNSLLMKYVVTEGSGAWETITGRAAEATAPPDVYYYYDTATGKLYRTPITAIPVATPATVGGIKLDQDNFRIGNKADDGEGNVGKLYLADDIYLKGNVFVQMIPESEPVSAEKLATETYVNTQTGLIRNKTDLMDVDYATNAFTFPGDVYEGAGKKLTTQEYADEAKDIIRDDAASFYGRLLSVTWERGGIGNDGAPKGNETYSPWIRTSDYVSLEYVRAIATAQNPKYILTKIFYYAYDADAGTYTYVSADPAARRAHLISAPSGATHCKVVATTEDYESYVSGGGIHAETFELYKNKIWLCSAYYSTYKAIMDVIGEIKQDFSGTHFPGDVFAYSNSRLFHYRGTLTSENDLDLIMASGIYFYNSVSRPLHTPTVHKCFVIVAANTSENSCAQIAVNYTTAGDSKLFFRNKTPGNDTFTAWKSALDSDSPVVMSRRKLIATDNMDLLLTPGLYWYDTGITPGVNRPLNTPTRHKSDVLVLADGDGKYVEQIVTNANGVKYYRTRLKSASFTAWSRVATAADIPDPSGGGDIVNNYITSPATFIRGADGRDIPQNTGVLNAYKKAHQLANVVYKATGIYKVSNAPAGHKVSSTDDFYGVPHSSVKEAEKYVGYDVSLYTFMTALNNPYSLLFTESARDIEYTEGGVQKHTYGVSKYDFTYRDTSDATATFYGTQCSEFVFYALGIPTRRINAQFNWMADKGILTAVPENRSTGVQLMDIVQEYGVDGTVKHCTLVTDIWRTERGVPTAIQVTESHSMTTKIKDGVAVPDATTGTDGYTIGDRTTVYTAEEFDRYLATTYNPILGTDKWKNNSGGHGHAQLYRYNQLWSNLEYAPSPFVAVDEETDPGSFVYNDDICTYAGDKASFRLGFPVHINYVNGSYTSMVVMRGSSSLSGDAPTSDYTLVETITLPGTYNDTHSIDVTEYCGTAGKYLAYLTNGVNSSNPTKWEVIDTAVSLTFADDSDRMADMTVAYNALSNPLSIEIVNLMGGQVCAIELTDAEIAAGRAEHIDVKEETASQEPGAPIGTPENRYVRVKFQGDYGRVVSRRINIADTSVTYGIDDSRALLLS